MTDYFAVKEVVCFHCTDTDEVERLFSWPSVLKLDIFIAMPVYFERALVELLLSLNSEQCRYCISM